jgi:ribosomal-protein-alanine N-acetyltransferase
VAPAAGRVSRVRPVTAGDLPRVATIEQSCFSNPWSPEALAAELSRSWARMLVAEDDSLPEVPIVGFVNYWVVADEVHVLNVATDPTHRRRGHGRALVSAMVASARAERARTMLLEVRASNAAAIALYREFGFRDVGLRRGYYDDGEDAVLMTADC